MVLRCLTSRSLHCYHNANTSHYPIKSFTQRLEHQNLGIPRSSFKRLASTLEPQPNDPEGLHHKEWPTNCNASPYEIFNIKPSEFNLKLLKKKYYEFAKIYHPDLSANRKLLNHKGDELTDELKQERFKIIMDAYTLLKDDRKKALYDQYKSGWRTHKPSRDTNDYSRYKRAAATYGNYGEAYWNAGSWEDYQNLKNMNDPALKEDKMKILGAIVLFVVTSATIQGWLILERVEETLLNNQKIHDTCEYDLGQCYINYGLDDSKMSRIKRFLWFRSFGLYIEKHDLDRSTKENEKLMKQIYGEENI